MLRFFFWGGGSTFVANKIIVVSASGMVLFLILYIGDDMQIHLNYFVNGYIITYIYRTYIEFIEYPKIYIYLQRTIFGI